MHRNSALSAAESLIQQGVDLLDRGIGHRVAADGDAGAMHHQRRAGPALGPLVGVGVTEVEAQVELAVRIELAGAHAVQPLRRLQIAFTGLRAQPPGPGADRIGPEQLELAATARLHPQFKFGLLLEDAQMDRIPRRRGKRTHRLAQARLDPSGSRTGTLAGVGRRQQPSRRGEGQHEQQTCHRGTLREGDARRHWHGQRTRQRGRPA